MSTTADPAATGGAFAERLTAPVGYWLIGQLVGVSSATAMAFYLAPEAAVVAGVLTAVAIAGVLLYAGRTRVRVDESGLRVGASLLEWDYIGAPIALDAERARARLGTGADTRAFVVAAPYIRTAVEVPVIDPADPHPYWLITTRHPQRLAAALVAGRARHRTEHP